MSHHTHRILHATVLVVYLTLISVGVQALPLMTVTSIRLTVTPIRRPTTVTPVNHRSWLCTGPYSDLEYRDCEGEYYNTTGCYFLPHFAQYRPCDQICNNVVVHSIQEEKCRSYCPGYLLESCQISTEASVSTEPDHMVPQTSFVIPVAVCGTLVLVITVTAVIVLSCVTLRRRLHKPSLSPPFSDLLVSSQESDEQTSEHDSEYSTEATQPSDTVKSLTHPSDTVKSLL